MAYYWCWNTSNFVFNSASPTTNKSDYSVKPTINGKNFISKGLYRSSANSITSFRAKQRFIFGSGANLTQKNNIRVYYTTTVRFHNNQKLTLVADITNKFNIRVITDTIMDITPSSTVSGSNLTLVIDFDNELEEEGISYNLVQNLENCTSNISGSEIEEGEQTITLTRTGTENLFYQVPYLVMGGVTHNFIVSENLAGATITLTIDNDIEIYGIAETKTLVIYDGATFNNCTCNYSDNEEYSVEKPIIISANSGDRKSVV